MFCSVSVAVVPTDPAAFLPPPFSSACFQLTLIATVQLRCMENRYSVFHSCCHRKQLCFRFSTGSSLEKKNDNINYIILNDRFLGRNIPGAFLHNFNLISLANTKQISKATFKHKGDSHGYKILFSMFQLDRIWYYAFYCKIRVFF